MSADNEYVVVVQSIELVEAKSHEEACAIAIETAKNNLKAVDWMIVG